MEITKKKKEVMEAILHSNAAIDSATIKWINSHLPNDKESTGENLTNNDLFTMKFDHNAGDVIKAIDSSIDNKKFIIDLNEKIKRDGKGKKLSESIEKAIKEYDSKELAFLIYLGIKLSKD